MGQFGSVAGETITANMEVVSLESVTVPAGTYTAFKISLKQVNTDLFGNTLLDADGFLWLTKDVGKVKSESTATAQGVTVTEMDELRDSNLISTTGKTRTAIRLPMGQAPQTSLFRVHLAGLSPIMSTSLGGKK